MAGLEGTVKTPLGAVQKKTLLIGVGAVALLGGIVWYRQRNLGGSDAVVADDAPINPATGYPYGSPEDAAALQAQAGYVSPAATGGGGSSNIPPSNVGFTSNQQWVQAVVEYMTNNSLVEDPTQLSSALGKYVTGAYVTDAEQGLIQQAIAVQGHAPVAGPSGYPPSINKTPPTTTTPEPVATNVTNASGLKLTGSSASTLSFGWVWGAVKPDYVLVYRDNVPIGNIPGAATTYVLRGLKSKTAYIFQVRGVKGTTIGPTSTTTGKTK